MDTVTRESETPRYLELLDAGSRVRQRITLLPGQSLTIGRALDCDLVIDDPYVCPRHLEVTLSTDGLHVRDLGSVNGLRTDRARRHRNNLVLMPGQRARFGHSRLHFTDANQALPATRRDSRQSPGMAWLQQPLAVIAVVIGMFGLMAWNQYLDATEGLEFSSWLQTFLSSLIALLAWGGAWSLVNRLVAQQFNFPAHVAIGALALLCSMITGWLLSHSAFALDIDHWLFWLNHAGTGVIIFLMLWAHLRLVARTSALGLGLASFTLVAAGMIITVLSTFSFQQAFRSIPHYQFTYKPPMYRIAEGRSPETFLAGMEAMRRELQEVVAEEKAMLPATGDDGDPDVSE